MKTYALLTFLLATTFAIVARATDCNDVFDGCMQEPTMTYEECLTKSEDCMNHNEGL